MLFTPNCSISQWKWGAGRWLVDTRYWLLDTDCLRQGLQVTLVARCFSCPDRTS